MTLNRNPKKSRPYDEPPKRRRRLIPDGADSAAIGFFVASAIWLAVATGIGALAIGIRLIPLELSFPLGLFDLSFEFDRRRVDYAFINATVFGWLTNAGFAAIAFMVPRLFGRSLAGIQLVNLAMLIWNMALAGGIAGLYVFDLGPNAALSAMPWLFEGGLATAALIVTGSFLATAGASIRTGYVSAWFAGVALLGLAGLLGLNATIGLVELFIELPALTVALASVFVERALVTIWLLGIAYATLHYVVPRATGQALASGGLAILTWLTWLALAPASALATLQDTSVPFIFTTLGSVATILLLVPAALAFVNLVQSMQGRWTLLFGTGTLAFAAVSLAFLLAASLLEGIGSLRTVDQAIGGTDWERGVFLWAAYGAFSFAAFALAEHAMPRVLRRAWGAGPLASAQLWLAFAGTTLAGLALMGGGLAEGSLRAAGTAPDAIDAALLLYRVPAFLGFGMVALAGLAMLVNLFLMYTSGEPVEYAIPGQASPAAAGH
ncbi:MAG TPA: cbb3-type cytochrome c oxidase subunit I [Candidatus Limnocylindria bacterium]